VNAHLNITSKCASFYITVDPKIKIRNCNPNGFITRLINAPEDLRIARIPYFPQDYKQHIELQIEAGRPSELGDNIQGECG
jgi:hypothetical protein